MSIDLPSASQRTVCELNCRLVHVDADSSISSPGLTYPSIQLDLSAGDSAAASTPAYIRGGSTAGVSGCGSDDEDEERWPCLLERLASIASPITTPLAGPARVVRRWLLGYGLDFVSNRLTDDLATSAYASPSRLSMAWHPEKATLAAADASGRVHVYDMGGSDAGLGMTLSGASGNPLVAGQAKLVLGHALQKEALSLAWRPCSGGNLAVGAVGGVCLWSTSGSMRPPMGAAVRGVASGGAGGRGPGPWMSVLKAPAGYARFTCLAWSPDGRLLAAAAPNAPGITLWDVSQGTCVQVSAGLAALTLLRWSPCGNYLFAAGAGARFYLWQTSTWTYTSWVGAPGAGRVTAAAWAPNSRVLLMSFAGRAAGHLVALHLVKEAPALTAQLMPVVLQDVCATASGSSSSAATSVTITASVAAGGRRPTAVEGGSSSRGAAALSTIEDFAWDATGSRLVVLLRPPHVAAGALALYATTTEPVVHARLVGFARPPAGMAAAAAAAPSDDAGTSADGAQQQQQPELGSAAGGSAAAAAFGGRLCMAGVFAKGALVSLRLGEGAIYNLPMYFK